MRTQLIFFDTKYNSGVLGTLRGCAAIGPILLPLALWARSSDLSPVGKVLTVTVVSLVLCSAIGVQLPKSYRESAVYASLVASVVSVCFVCGASLAHGEFRASYLSVIPAAVATLVVSALTTRALSLRFRLYGNSQAEAKNDRR